MASHADERSRILGGLVCLGALVAGALFLYGVSVDSYLALALPLGALVIFVLGLVFWIGWTILTVQVEAEGEPLTPPGGGPGAATVRDPAASEEAEPPIQGSS